ncbi:sulfurtransferase TusA family protein [Acetobacter tropicalis]|uniref:SirA family protein n=3 Tax=Acetobacter TaxID=434 RepID=A0A0U4Y6S0_9PROT|nr:MULTISPECIES: sulfurtransferase TusA family protein [Acetobacter]ATJ91726.1 sulfurtransferase tusA [Acetobacter tropicalis]KAA8390390.1 sulfurtransferase TusA family protein [Acetobacter tropicalis]KAA8391741.1 sulfurtransferase TusA family protein [Acetobacter tropicalis]KGB26528.1 hypothetical protein AtDm6_0154 [Acetobacter tropicalis]KXV49471.1 sulfurtransferase tusA [Acetobacter tropicalis]
MNEALLDARGLSCPIPVLKANKRLRSMESGEKLRVLTTDRASIVDFQVFCRETGHALVAFTDENGTLSFTIRRRTDIPQA